MITVARARGVRIVIYADDHEPAHVHVFGDGEAKINLVGPDGSPEMLWSKSMNLQSSGGRSPRRGKDKPSCWTGGGRFMVDVTDQELELAAERGRQLWATEPRAASARYDRKAGRVVVDLTNGSTFAFPTGNVQGLEQATPEQLAEVEILGEGYGLHWETLDVDFTVPGLLAGIFGTRAYMARRAGQATSPAKAAAARTNGAKGGRPRKAG